MPPKIMMPLIVEINQQIAIHEAEIKALTQTRVMLQNLCTHEFETTGTDHNYTYQTCTICQLNRKL